MKKPFTDELMKSRNLDPETLSKQSGVPLETLKRILERNTIASEAHRAALASVLGSDPMEMSWELKTPQVDLVGS